jgi:DNA polymerase-3 subunit gamma/tau
MRVIYRKYRPQTLKEILGQETITTVLQNAAKKNRLAHAYLFYGPRGSGKTTTARILAKIANCEKRFNDQIFIQQGEPCNACRSCQEIDEGRSLDVIEIDAASNRGIDEIRDLKENIKFPPAVSLYKIFIIDEAHQLTKEAFNALLKTLEEPPTQVIFILATTEYEKMPATIISRTQRFHFKRLPLSAMIKKLQEIAKKEKIAFEDNAIELIATAAEGSMRDAESLLEQIASLEKKINIETVEKILGQVGFLKITTIADLIIKRDLKKSLSYISKINEEGYNLVHFSKDLIHYFRRVLALKFAPHLETLFKEELTDAELQKIKEHSQLINPENTIALLKSLIKAYTEMRYSSFSLVSLEIAIIENLKSKQN